MDNNFLIQYALMAGGSQTSRPSLEKMHLQTKYLQ